MVKRGARLARRAEPRERQVSALIKRKAAPGPLAKLPLNVNRASDQDS
jgi:hypothetical protein